MGLISMLLCGFILSANTRTTSYIHTTSLICVTFRLLFGCSNCETFHWVVVFKQSKDMSFTCKYHETVKKTHYCLKGTIKRLTNTHLLMIFLTQKENFLCKVIAQLNIWTQIVSNKNQYYTVSLFKLLMG